MATRCFRRVDRLPVVVNRNGAEVSLTITPTTSRTENGETAGFLDFIPDYGGLPVMVGDVSTGSPAEEAGLKEAIVWLPSATKTSKARCRSLSTFAITTAKDPDHG